ncbi:GTPase-activating protein, partial [Physocladia obscura]
MSKDVHKESISIKNPQEVRSKSEAIASSRPASRPGSASPSGRAKTAESEMLGAVAELNSKAIRFKKFETLLEQPLVDMEQLKKLSWMGVPEEIRHTVWKLLMVTTYSAPASLLLASLGGVELSLNLIIYDLQGYLPTNSTMRDKILAQKRLEYDEYVTQQFIDGKATLDQALVHQIHIDILRTNSNVPLYQNAIIQESLERILYIWAVRHPASGYVQGINDLATPFYQVFLQPHVSDDVERTDVGLISKDDLKEVEADTYWCLSRLLDGIQ